MVKNRIPIPDELDAKVMFASDRTCCICCDPIRKTEIHHIDNDPSNNAFDNLAVVCKDQHSDAHTTQAFARNLTPEIIPKYNESWRATIRARLSPTGDQDQRIEYKQEELLKIGLVPHTWKILYIDLYPGQFRDTGYSSTECGSDVWDMLSKVLTHRCSIDEWKKYIPLFDSAINVIVELNGILAAHGEVVPVPIKLAVLRANSQLKVERSAYLYLPQLVETFADKDVFFTMRFIEAIKPLSSLSRLVDKERTALEPPVPPRSS